MRFPLTLRFKFFSLTSEIYVTDADGATVFYVKQKLLKLREAITVFADEQMRQARYTIQADRVIDFSAQYHITDANGQRLGAVRRKGMRSLWKAHYEIVDESGRHVMTLSEENPWIKLLDSLLSDIPVLGVIAGYVLNPTYLVSTTEGAPVIRLRKTPSLLERRFSIEAVGDAPEQAQMQALLGALMMVLLERSRG